MNKAKIIFSLISVLCVSNSLALSKEQTWGPYKTIVDLKSGWDLKLHSAARVKLNKEKKPYFRVVPTLYFRGTRYNGPGNCYDCFKNLFHENLIFSLEKKEVIWKSTRKNKSVVCAKEKRSWFGRRYFKSTGDCKIKLSKNLKKVRTEVEYILEI